MIDLHNQDCLEAMKQMKDNQFDLAIVDPPYGIDLGNNSNYFAYKGGKRASKGIRNKNKDWDKNTPTDEYWTELFRVSKNQIVWGGNFFIDKLYISRGWICWDKKQPEKNSFSDFDLAWSSFDCINRTYRLYPTHVTQGKKIHPSQKPMKLYEWLLDNYAKEGDKILDTHLGSGSIALACHNRGFDLTAFEIDEEYYNNAVKRLKTHQQQLTMF